MLNAYNHVYLGSPCRAKVRRFLVNKFPIIADAEEAYQITYIGPSNLSRPSASARIMMLRLSPSSDENLVHLPGNVIDMMNWHDMAGSTDDAKRIFAFLHGLLDLSFMRRTSMMPFPKVISKFTRKCDPDCPFITTLVQMTDTKMVHHNHSMYHLVVV